MNKVAINLDCALMMACDRLGQYGGCPKYGFEVSDEKRDSCEWADDGYGYCSYTDCWRRHLMELAAKVR